MNNRDQITDVTKDDGNPNDRNWIHLITDWLPCSIDIHFYPFVFVRFRQIQNLQIWKTQQGNLREELPQKNVFFSNAKSDNKWIIIQNFKYFLSISKRKSSKRKGTQKCWMRGGRHIIPPKKQFKVHNICIFDDIDSFYWPKMQLVKKGKQIRARVPPPFRSMTERKHFFAGGAP